MTAVERVIFDVLARRGSVALPGVGSLEVKRRKAHRVSETRVIPPQDVVVFTRDEPREVPSVVDLLNRNSNMEMDDAWASYNEWVGETRDGDALVIEGVGTLRGERFEPTDHLHEMLNPTGAHDETSRDDGERGYDDGRGGRGGSCRAQDRRRCKCWPWWAWVLTVLGVGMLICVVLQAVCPDFCRDFWDGLNGRKPRTEVVVAVPAPVVDSTAMAAPALETVPAGPIYHVIAGAFLVPGNAELRMEELRREGFTVRKVVNPNGYEMVSIFSSPQRAAAQRELNRNLDLDPCGWIYVE